MHLLAANLVPCILHIADWQVGNYANELAKSS